MMNGQAKVIQFPAKEERFQATLNNEQKLKLFTLETIFEDKKQRLHDLFDKGLTVDYVFARYADMLFCEDNITNLH